MRYTFLSKIIFSNSKHIINGISSLVGLIIIVVISTAIGVGLYLYVNKMFIISTPRSTIIEIPFTCYNISYNGYENRVLCLVYNDLDIVLPLKIYLENGSIINYNLKPSTMNIIGCEKPSNITGWYECSTLRNRIIYVESAIDNIKVKISILYKDFKPIVVK